MTIDLDYADYYVLLHDRDYIFTEQTPGIVKQMLKRKSKILKEDFVSKNPLLSELYKFCEIKNITILFRENEIYLTLSE